MPRYNYQCSACEHTETVFMSMSETLEDCPECGEKNSMVKLFNKFFSKSIVENKQKVGSVTKEYIEKNREILKEAIKEAQGTEYEPS